MKKRNFSLQLHIPEPCDEKWANMTPVQGGRFCHQCDRHIVDFTHLTDAQILQHYHKRNGKICGMFPQDQLGRDIQLPLSASKFQFWKKVAAVSAGLMMSQVAVAQNLPVSDTIVIERQFQEVQGKVTQDLPSNKILKGTIVDADTDEPLIYARILVEGTDIETTTNLDGSFELLVPETIISPTIVVSYTGYETVYLKDVNTTIRLHGTMQEALLGIIGYSFPKKKSFWSRLFSKKSTRTQKEHQFESASKSIETTPSPVFPNPFYQELSIKLEIEVADTYLINLYDIAGNLKYAQSTDLAKGEQVVSLEHLPTHLACGNYVLQIVRGDEIILTEKVSKVE